MKITNDGGDDGPDAQIYPNDEEADLIDVLWVGNHNPTTLIGSALSHFRVIFNGLDNIDELIDMRTLRD